MFENRALKNIFLKFYYLSPRNAEWHAGDTSCDEPPMNVQSKTTGYVHWEKNIFGPRKIGPSSFLVFLCIILRTYIVFVLNVSVSAAGCGTDGYQQI
jgi:hypothetical protein